MFDLRVTPATKILEIGYGNSPAALEGSRFQDPSVRWIGLELPLSFGGNFGGFGTNRHYNPGLTRVTGDMSLMPFADGTIDCVLMRSVFGQFDSRPEVIKSVRMGMYEIARILKPLGKLIVAE